MQKLIVALIAVQIATAISLAMQFSKFDERLSELQTNAAASAAATNKFANATQPLMSVGASLTSTEIRNIIREEIEQLAILNTTAIPAGPNAPQTQAARTPRWDDTELAHDLTRDLDSYLSRGVISDVEMAKFQRGLAKLPKSQQRKLLNKMTAAISKNGFRANL